jgi:hypothetical protein
VLDVLPVFFEAERFDVFFEVDGFDVFFVTPAALRFLRLAGPSARLLRFCVRFVVRADLAAMFH